MALRWSSSSSSASDLIELGAAVGAEHHLGERRHLAHGCYPAPAVADALDGIEGLLIDDGFVAVLEDLPVSLVVVHLLLVLVGSPVGLEVYDPPDVLLS